jgi:addiction module HigA family antidote
MARKLLKPVHPGEVLRCDFLEPLGISLYRLSKETGVSAQQWGRIVHGARSITADTALRLARYFGTSPRVWMNLQAQYDLDVASDEIGRALQSQVRPLRITGGAA